MFGSQIRFWRQSENRYLASDVDARKKTDYVVDGLEQNTMYELRVLGYSRGGDGLMSSPIIQFVLGKNCYVREGTCTTTLTSCRNILNILFASCRLYFKVLCDCLLDLFCRLHCMCSFHNNGLDWLAESPEKDYVYRCSATAAHLSFALVLVSLLAQYIITKL